MNRSEQAARLESRRKQIRLWYAAYLVLLLCCVALFYFHQLAAGICFGVCILGYFTVIRGGMRRYRADVREARVRGQAERYLEEVAYSEKSGVDRRAVACWELLPVPQKEGMLVRDVVNGRAGEIAITCCDLTLPYRSGQTGRGVDFLSGFWCEAVLPADTGLHLRLWDAELFDGPPPDGLGFSSAEECAGELVGMRMARTGEGGELPAKAQKLLGELRGFTPGALAVAVQGDRACFFVSSRFFTGPDVPLRQELDESVLGADTLPELGRMLEVARRLGGTVCGKDGK